MLGGCSYQKVGVSRSPSPSPLPPAVSLSPPPIPPPIPSLNLRKVNPSCYSVLYCIANVLYCTALHCVVLHLQYIVLYCIALYCNCSGRDLRLAERSETRGAPAETQTPRYSVLYCTSLPCVVLQYSVLYCTASRCTVIVLDEIYALFKTRTTTSTSSYSVTSLQRIVFYCIVLYCTALHCVVLQCIVLYCIALYCNCSGKSFRTRSTLCSTTRTTTSTSSDPATCL